LLLKIPLNKNEDASIPRRIVIVKKGVRSLGSWIDQEIYREKLVNKICRNLQT